MTQSQFSFVLVTMLLLCVSHVLTLPHVEKADDIIELWVSPTGAGKVCSHASPCKLDEAFSVIHNNKKEIILSFYSGRYLTGGIGGVALGASLNLNGTLDGNGVVISDGLHIDEKRAGETENGERDDNVFKLEGGVLMVKNKQITLRIVNIKFSFFQRHFVSPDLGGDSCKKDDFENAPQGGTIIVIENVILNDFERTNDGSSGSFFLYDENRKFSVENLTLINTQLTKNELGIGFFNDYKLDVKIDNCIVRDNSEGGVLIESTEEINAKVVNSHFMGNSLGYNSLKICSGVTLVVTEKKKIIFQDEGSEYIKNIASPICINSNGDAKVGFYSTEFNSNVALHLGGGGAFVSNSNMEIIISSSKFINNYSPLRGGVFVANSENLTVAIKNSNFANNGAYYQGGALDLYANDIKLDISKTTFLSNSGENGAALYISGVYVDIYSNDNIFRNNSASGSKSGAFLLYAQDLMMIINNVLYENNVGGGFYTRILSGKVDIILSKSNFINNYNAFTFDYEGNQIKYSESSEFSVTNLNITGSNFTSNRGNIYIEYDYKFTSDDDELSKRDDLSKLIEKNKISIKRNNFIDNCKDNIHFHVLGVKASIKNNHFLECDCSDVISKNDNDDDDDDDDENVYEYVHFVVKNSNINLKSNEWKGSDGKYTPMIKFSQNSERQNEGGETNSFNEDFSNFYVKHEVSDEVEYPFFNIKYEKIEMTDSKMVLKGGFDGENTNNTFSMENGLFKENKTILYLDNPKTIFFFDNTKFVSSQGLVLNSFKEAKMQRCRFDSNKKLYDYKYGGAIYAKFNDYSQMEITETRFEYNEAYVGGTFFFEKDNSSVIQNKEKMLKITGENPEYISKSDFGDLFTFKFDDYETFNNVEINYEELQEKSIFIVQENEVKDSKNFQKTIENAFPIVTDFPEFNYSPLSLKAKEKVVKCKYSTNSVLHYYCKLDLLVKNALGKKPDFPIESFDFVFNFLYDFKHVEKTFKYSKDILSVNITLVFNSAVEIPKPSNPVKFNILVKRFDSNLTLSSIDDLTLSLRHCIIKGNIVEYLTTGETSDKCSDDFYTGIIVFVVIIIIFLIILAIVIFFTCCILLCRTRKHMIEYNKTYTPELQKSNIKMPVIDTILFKFFFLTKVSKKNLWASCRENEFENIHLLGTINDL